MSDDVRGWTHALSDVKGCLLMSATMSSSQRACTENCEPPEKYETRPVKARIGCPRLATGLNEFAAAAVTCTRACVSPVHAPLCDVASCTTSSKSFCAKNCENSEQSKSVGASAEVPMHAVLQSFSLGICPASVKLIFPLWS